MTFKFTAEEKRAVIGSLRKLGFSFPNEADIIKAVEAARVINEVTVELEFNSTSEQLLKAALFDVAANY